MSDKYSGVWVPGMDGGDESEADSSPPSRSGAYQPWMKERDENKVRLAAWMNGREPRQWWEEYASGERFFCMEFPTTVHYLVAAWEKRPEYGRLYVWCFGCKNDICGACTWIRKAYVTEIQSVRRIGRTQPDDLPF